MNYKKILDKCPDCSRINSPREEVCLCGCSLIESVIDVDALEGRVGKIENQLQKDALEGRVGKIENQLQKLVKDSESFGKPTEDQMLLEMRVSDIESKLQKLVKDSESWSKSAKDLVFLETRVGNLENQLEEIEESFDDKVATLKFYILQNVLF